MKHLFSILFLIFSLSLSAQATPPDTLKMRKEVKAPKEIDVEPYDLRQNPYETLTPWRKYRYIVELKDGGKLRYHMAWQTYDTYKCTVIWRETKWDGKTRKRKMTYNVPVELVHRVRRIK